MKPLLILLSPLLLSMSLHAQPTINGYVYEIQTGEALEGTRVQLKDRTGLEIGKIQPVYTDEAGYFEFPNLKPKDYRLEINHVFETSRGPTGMRLFTLKEVIPIDSSDVQITAGLSRWTAEHFHKSLERMKIYQEHTSFDEKTRKRTFNGPDSLLARLNADASKDRLLQSRLYVDFKEYDVVETAQPLSSAMR